MKDVGIYWGHSAYVTTKGDRYYGDGTEGWRCLALGTGINKSWPEPLTASRRWLPWWPFPEPTPIWLVRLTAFMCSFTTLCIASSGKTVDTPFKWFLIRNIAWRDILYNYYHRPCLPYGGRIHMELYFPRLYFFLAVMGNEFPCVVIMSSVPTKISTCQCSWYWSDMYESKPIGGTQKPPPCKYTHMILHCRQCMKISQWPPQQQSGWHGETCFLPG